MGVDPLALRIGQGGFQCREGQPDLLLRFGAAGRRSSPLLQRRKASLKLHHSKARIAALMLAPQNQ